MEDRLAIANAALQCFVPDTRMEIRSGRVFIVWTDYLGKTTSRMWMCRGGDFYPVWSHKWAHGGTCTTALSQLVRFVRGLPVLPLSTWAYWCGEQVGLAAWRGKDKQTELLAILKAGGYPQQATCIMCGKSPIGRFDWYRRGNKSGPGCLPMCDMEGK